MRRTVRSPRRSRPVVWNLRLYVAGQTPRSISAIDNLRKICDNDLPGRYKIEVIDLARAPHRARTDDIVAIPTLVRRLPSPFRKIIGDLSDRDRVLVSLEVEKS